MWWWCTLSFILLTFVTPHHQVKCHQQLVSTKLYAPWKSTSILAEAAEYVADLEPSLYWKFIDDLIEKLQHFPTPTTEDGEIDLASVVAFNLISPSKLRLMEWTLRSRTFSPKVLSLQQLAPNEVGNECGDAFVVLDSRIICQPNDLKAALEKSQVKEDDLKSVITDADHKYPSLIWAKEAEPRGAILFAKITSPLTPKFHSILKEWSDRVGYVMRPYAGPKGISATTGAEKLLLAGYGIELQFKSQEYKAQDDSANSNKNETAEVAGFLFDKLHELHPDAGEALDKFQNYLASGRSGKAQFEALKAWQVQELGLQASHFTTIQENFLEALLDVSGNFPSRAAALSSIRVPAEFKRSIAYNQRLLSSHFNVDEGEGAFFLQGTYLDPDSLDLFSFMDNLKSELGLMELVRSLRHEQPDVKRTDVDKILSLGTKSSSEPELALDLRDSAIFWINDLEKDEEYEDWPDDLTQLFFRMGGIMLRPVRRNVFNLVMTLDPLDTASAGGLLKLAQSFMAHKSPVRIGVVFCAGGEDPEDRSTLIRRAMNYALSEGKTRIIFNEIVQAYLTDDFTKLVEKRGDLGEEFDFGGESACDFVKRSGRPTPAGFLNGVPLKWESLDDFEEVVLNQLLREAQSVQIEAYNGRVNEDTDIFEYLMNKPNVQTRLNDKILDSSNSRYLNFGTEIWIPGKEVKQNALGRLASSLDYLVASGKRKSPITVTIWAFADLESEAGRSFLDTAIQFMAESATHSRLAFISTSEFKSQLTKNVEQAFLEQDIKKIQKLLAEATQADYSPSQEVNEKGLQLMKLLSLRPQSKGVVVNGRVIGPLDSTETFQLGDWSLIQKFSYDACPKYLEGEEWESDSIMRLCSALGSPSLKKNSKRFTLPEFQSPFYVERREGASSDVFHVDLLGVIDPASRHAHKMAALLSAVQHTLGQWIHIRVIFNPPSKHSELPVKSYYRYVAGYKSAETIVFENIPRDPLFTQNIFAPDNWMVEVVKCDKDLDNIRLSDLGTESVSSEYELEHLLVEGHCLETKSGSPPRGLQFILTPHNPSVRGAETIVMANLGYFQLKAKPGLWTLGLREGPSRDIFAIESQNVNPISVNSFQSIVVKVKVKRNPGKESVSVLDSEEESGGWFGFGSKKTEVEEETINVFSVASGHLYERVLRIMMLSVLKNTKSKVKFWFLKNYLSPTLKDLLPEMAVEYGFEYELVQYHWPRWLNPQREKQRIIWGYKILFLDVLFPLSTKKIVFVDADQVVRADLKELFDLDLEGNPYGYTPFCDSRTEMEGFRFWKQGYWKSHLGRRKYHISALYVVDLVRFRRIAAGDRLRGQYQALSQDPNSLSNLDQDLPNNMIHQVGIKSLPQEWLWCETWCDDASKKNAKTIDLCNNPQTKEPKLDAAQRIVPEWKDYDQEIRDFQQRLREKSLNKSSKSKSHEPESDLERDEL